MNGRSPGRVPLRNMAGLFAVAIPAFVVAAILVPHSAAGLRELLLSLGPLAPAIAIAAWIVLIPARFRGTVLAAAGGLASGALGGRRHIRRPDVATA